MTKRVLLLALALVLAFSMLCFSTLMTLAAGDSISVYLDGLPLTFDVPPQIINDRTMVPLRAVFEAFGATVEWDGATQTVTGTKGDTVVVLTIGSVSPTINGKVVTIDQPGVIVNDRTLAPLRFVGEAFDGKVDWDGATNTVTITSGTSKINNSDEYISVTINHETFYDVINDYTEYGVSIYEYDLQSAKMSEIFNFPQNSMYALGCYDKKSNSVFYTKEKNNDTYKRRRTGDQIYMYKLDTGADIRLTEDLLAVNYVIPVDNFVFFVGARLNNVDSLALGKINLTDGTIEYWNESDTLSVETISIDRIKKRIYVAVYDSLERDIAIDLFNSGASPHPVAFKHSICSYNYDLDDKRDVLSKDDMRIYTVYARDGRLLYGAHDETVLQSEAYDMSEVIDINNKDVLFQSNEHFSWMGGGFSHDLKGVYYVVRDDDFAGIVYFDFETRERKTIIEIDLVDFGYFANMQLVY